MTRNIVLAILLLLSFDLAGTFIVGSVVLGAAHPALGAGLGVCGGAFAYAGVHIFKAFK